MKQPKQPEIIDTPNPNDWTEKQLSTVRRDCVQLAIEAYKSNNEVPIIGMANEIYNFVKDGTVPETKAQAQTETKTGGWT